mgnify:CR=1 FL=1
MTIYAISPFAQKEEVDRFCFRECKQILNGGLEIAGVPYCTCRTNPCPYQAQEMSVGEVIFAWGKEEIITRKLKEAMTEPMEGMLKIDDLKVVATQKAILKRIVQIADKDMFGEYRPRLIGFLDYEHVKPFLKDGVKEEDWEQSGEADLRSQLHDYMEDWWRQKVEDGRGISVHRGRAQVVNLLFLAGVEAWKAIGIDDEEGMDGGWYQEDAYNMVADIFGMPHIKGYREGGDMSTSVS